MKRHDRPEAAVIKWSLPVMVCGECAKRTGADNQPSALRRSLRKELSRRGVKRSVRVLECTCLGVCPKRGVTVVVGASAAMVVERPTQWSQLASTVEDQLKR